MSEPYDDERPAVEGVRILGAEEAHASLGETRGAASDDPAAEPVDLEEDEPQLDLRDPAPTVDADAVVASVRAGSEAMSATARTTQSWSAAHDDLLPGQPLRDQPAATPVAPVAAPHVASEGGEVAPLAARSTAGEPDDPPTGEIPPLPHWTEPPTGAVPAIFADDAESPEEADAWATVTGAEPRFRAGSDWAESDFAEDLSEESVKLGALSNDGPVDEDEEFERDLAARRPGPAAGAATRPRRPPRTRTPGPSRLEADRGA